MRLLVFNTNCDCLIETVSSNFFGHRLCDSYLDLYFESKSLIHKTDTIDPITYGP